MYGLLFKFQIAYHLNMCKWRKAEEWCWLVHEGFDIRAVLSSLQKFRCFLRDRGEFSESIWFREWLQQMNFENIKTIVTWFSVCIYTQRKQLRDQIKFWYFTRTVHEKSWKNSKHHSVSICFFSFFFGTKISSLHTKYFIEKKHIKKERKKVTPSSAWLIT